MQKSPNESQILQEYIYERQKQEAWQAQRKKNYLKENILDLYGKQQQLIDKFIEFFLVYLKKAKGIETQQHNIDLLTFEQLKELVHQFHTLYPSAENAEVIRMENSFDVDLSRINSLSEIDEEQFDAQKVYYPNGSWDYELIGYEQCKKVKLFFAVEEDYKNHLVIFEKQQIRKVGGFFGIGCRQELWIEMRSNLFKQYIMRKIEDFVALSNILAKSFPFVFIYPLSITQKHLQNVSEEAVRAYLINQCRKFINYVSKNELLLQNLYTHRFFKEQNYQNYLNHQKAYGKEMKSQIKLIQNVDGCVPLQISDKNESLKKDYLKKGEELQRIWNKLDQSNSRIGKKLKQVQIQIQKQRKQVQKMILEFTNVNPMLKSKNYENIISTMIGYNEIFKNYQENLNNFQFLFDSVNLQVATQSKKTWAFFNKYAKEITDISNQYGSRRKVFLEKEAKKTEEATGNEKETIHNGQEKQQIDPVNKSIIIKLGISSNSLKETIWIERFSKWQGYMNKQFTNSFQRLLQSDVDVLNRILRQNISNRCQMHRKQQYLIKSLQSIP